MINKISANYRTVAAFSLPKAERQSKVGGKDIPGPGAYEHKTEVGEGPKVSLSSKRNESKPLKGVPGPGTYDPKKEAISEKKPVVTIPLASRGTNTNQSKFAPGPGAYTTADIKSKGPSFSIGTGSRSNFINVRGGPGPGNYNIESSNLPSYEKAKMKVN